MVIVTVSEARAQLPALIDRVDAGEEITLTRHGRKVAVVVRPDALRTRRADAALEVAARVHDLLGRGRAIPLSEAGGITTERADELVASVRDGRSAR